MSRSNSGRGGLSVTTLAVASAASALATFLVPMIWRPGTIPAAATMPVIVALISEALSRPAQHVTQAGRLVRVPRTRLGRRGFDALGRHRVRLAVATGLLAFVATAVVITTTELATGKAVSTDQRTTLLGGEAKPADDPPAPAATPAATPDGPVPATEATETPDPAAEQTPDATTPDNLPPPVPTATPTPPPPAAAPNATPAP